MEREDFLKAYCYELPPELIASRGVEPRDSARMMVVDTVNGAVTLDTFRNFAQRVPNDALVIFNDTRVVPARLALYKETGGKAEVLLLLNEYKIGDISIRALANRKLEIGWRMRADDTHTFRVAGQQEKIFFLEPEFPTTDLPLLLERYGETPVPHYLGESGLSEAELRTRYQSTFAEAGRETASVAAPTASLHFTDHVFADMRARGIEHVFVTLHVGLGTFAPLTPEHIKAGKLHEEPFTIPKETVQAIRRAHDSGRPIIAVGTTATRTLEAASHDIFSGEVHSVSGVTDIFIRPGYPFKVVSGMVTNFHLPQTSLMMLVDAFLQFKKSPKTIQELYMRAIAEKMRFYSFGDGMLIF